MLCSHGYLDSGFLTLSMSMEILKNPPLSKFCKVDRKYAQNIRNQQMTLSKMILPGIFQTAHILEAAVVTLRTQERVPILKCCQCCGQLATSSSVIKSTLPEKPTSVKINFHLEQFFFHSKHFHKVNMKLFVLSFFPLFSDRK